MSCLCSTMSGPQLGRLGLLGALNAAALTYGVWAGMSQRLIVAGMQTKYLHVEEPFALGFSQDVGWVLEKEPFKRIRWKRHIDMEVACIIDSSAILCCCSGYGFSQVQENRAKIPYSMGQKSTNWSHVFSPPQMLFEFEVLPPVHSYFKGRSSNTGSMGMDS